MRLVEVLWEDCYTHCEQPWYDRAELDRLATGNVPILTAGYVFKEDSENLTITMSYHEESPDSDEVGMAITIPLRMVREVRDLGCVSTMLRSNGNGKAYGEAKEEIAEECVCGSGPVVSCGGSGSCCEREGACVSGCEGGQDVGGAEGQD